MTVVKTIGGEVLFSFDENETTLAQEIGEQKYLAFADLKGADLRGADLSDANITSANLIGANLQNADIRGANLFCAGLKEANLQGADLKGADLRGADLIGAKLKGADFTEANVLYANFSKASGVQEIPLACPAEGKFIAWKKVGCYYLVKLEIPEDARRSSATTKKCRCDKAFVLDIEDLYTDKHPKMVVNMNYTKCVYEVGKMVYPDSFDENRWNECSNGIHFFMDRQDAVHY